MSYPDPSSAARTQNTVTAEFDTSRPDPDPPRKPRFSGRMRGQPGGRPGPGLGRHFARVGMEIDHHHVGRQGRCLVEAGGIVGRDVKPRAHGV